MRETVGRSKRQTHKGPPPASGTVSGRLADVEAEG
jgi:hypothetical protein